MSVEDPDTKVVLLALNKAENILSLLHHLGLVDSPGNRRDVADALAAVEDALWPDMGPRRVMDDAPGRSV